MFTKKIFAAAFAVFATAAQAAAEEADVSNNSSGEQQQRTTERTTVVEAAEPLKPSALLRVYDMIGVPVVEEDGEEAVIDAGKIFIEGTGAGDAEPYVVVQSDELTTFASDSYEFDGPADIKFVPGKGVQVEEGVLSPLTLEVEGQSQGFFDTPNGKYVFAVLELDPVEREAFEAAATDD